MFQHTGIPLQIDHNAAPYYLLFRVGHPPYVLNIERRVLRREASLLLRSFARARITPTSMADEAWNDFSGLESISLPERADVLVYKLVSGAESEHQLRLLASL